jgi:hypothetical protein
MQLDDSRSISTALDEVKEVTLVNSWKWAMKLRSDTNHASVIEEN